MFDRQPLLTGFQRAQFGALPRQLLAFGAQQAASLVDLGFVLGNLDLERADDRERGVLLGGQAGNAVRQRRRLAQPRQTSRLRLLTLHVQ